MMRGVTAAAIVVATIALASCTSSEGAATHALKAHGFTDIEITGFRWNACYMPMSQTGFRAKNSQGMTVTGVACEGLDGRFDIRLD